MKENVVENLRRVMGTLPSEHPAKQTKIMSMEETIEITLEDYSVNPYRAMFVSATSTWGNNEFAQKWPLTSLAGKLEVIKAVLCHKTLPQAKEAVMFTFRVARVPRLIFDYHAQSVNHCFFMSQGLRDNNRIDADILIDNSTEEDKKIFDELKDFYEFALTDNGSWQSARAFLPQSYCHSYHFGQNLLSIISTRGFHAAGKFGDSYKEQKLLYIYQLVAKAVANKFPLLGLYISMLWQGKEEIMKQIKSLDVDTISELDLRLLNKIEL